MRLGVARTVVTVGVLAAGVGVPAGAQAAPRSDSSGAVSGFSAQAGWVSDSALAKNPALRTELGIPVTAGQGGVRSASAANLVVVPATSGTNCDAQVCGKVYGTGLHITKISTSAEGNAGCIQAHYVIVKGTDYGDGPVLRTASGSVVCAGAGPGTYYYNFTNQVPDQMPYTCPTTSILGIFWDSIAGDPRFTIHP